MLIYALTAYLPCFIKDAVETRNNSSNISYHHYHQTDFNKKTILDIFFPVSILARLCLPKGKISSADFSKLLLINMTLVADILDMIKILQIIITCKFIGLLSLFVPTLIFTYDQHTFYSICRFDLNIA